MNRTERHRGILDRLSESGTVEVDDLVGRLGVSPATIRRDLETLHEQRLLDRTHGGAVAINGLYELPLRYRGSLHRDEKQRIARAAAARIPDGATIALTGGTTTTEIGRMLVDREGLTVVTNAINIAAELAIRPNIRMIVSGGVARAASYELVGPLADDTLSQLHVEHAFVGVDGITGSTGITTHREVEARTNRMTVERAAKVTVVADASKIGTTALARICDLGQITTLITSEGADPEQLREIEAAGVEVEVA
jgi:DeoR family transcriptional regulator of aga operon